MAKGCPVIPGGRDDSYGTSPRCRDARILPQSFAWEVPPCVRGRPAALRGTASDAAR